MTMNDKTTNNTTVTQITAKDTVGASTCLSLDSMKLRRRLKGFNFLELTD
jgi:hypothetical protein